MILLVRLLGQGVLLLLATTGCNGVDTAEMEVLRKRVKVLESSGPDLATISRFAPATHGHPRLTLSNIRGCGLPDVLGTGSAYGYRGLVFDDPVSNQNYTERRCRLASFSLLNKPGPGGPGPCPADFDLVVTFGLRIEGSRIIQQDPVHFEIRGTQVYETGNVSVSTPEFLCEHGPESIHEVWIVPPKDAKKLVENNTQTAQKTN